MRRKKLSPKDRLKTILAVVFWLVFASGMILWQVTYRAFFPVKPREAFTCLKELILSGEFVLSFVFLILLGLLALLYFCVFGLPVIAVVGVVAAILIAGLMAVLETVHERKKYQEELINYDY